MKWWPSGQGVYLSTQGSWVQSLHRVMTMIPVLVVPGSRYESNLYRV